MFALISIPFGSCFRCAVHGYAILDGFDLGIARSIVDRSDTTDV